MFRQMGLAAFMLIAGISQAKATPITFNPLGNGAGAGAIAGVTGFTYTPGNVIGFGGTTAIVNFATAMGSPNFTGFGQANLALTTGNVQSILAGNLTTVLGVSETVLTLAGAPGGGSTATFGLNGAGTVNYVEIFANASPGNDLAGTGFNAGTRIFAGTITALNTLAPFSTATTPVQDLDQNAGDNYPGVDTLPGGGQIRVLGNVTFFDPNYFVPPAGETLDTFAFDAQLSTPFLNVDPSGRFLTGTTTTAVGGVPQFAGAGTSLGTINLSAPPTGGPDTQFQAVGNISLTTRQLPPPPDNFIPEPVSMASFGVLCLSSGLVGAMRRRNKKVS